VLGVDLSVHDSDPGGAKPAIVCLHAIGHGGGDFAGVEQALSGRYRIVTLDWPGQGFSGDDAQPAGAARYTALLEALLGELHLGPVVLLGNSIGGAVAIGFAAAHPEQVRALVLANPGGLDPGGLFAGLFIGHLVGLFERGERGEARFIDWYKEYYQDILITEASAARRAAIVAAGYEHAAILAQAWRSFGEPEARLTPLLPRVTMPVLITWARQDGLIQWSRNRDAVALFPDAQVLFFAAGHSPFLETPAEFLRAVEPFLELALR
jgi:4,5:9,10-diseco-3-hydroxy-5,9,17-trioxoandrosta-1(10),2-diene-4-oate hydrolase